MPKPLLKIGVIGASGYTGGELLRLLAGHPQVKVSTVTADKSAGTLVSTLFPNLKSFLPHTIESTNLQSITKQVDVVFLALPHTQSMEPVRHFVQAKKMVLDLSADFRLKDQKNYERWYQVPHTAPELLKKVVYGLPELYRSKISKSKFVAVPGCYPTAAILQPAPLIAHNIIKPQSIIIDAKSGISGAGRTPAAPFHFPEAHESIKAYKIGVHRHSPEIAQELTHLQGVNQASGKKKKPALKVTFTPHLLPINRGILSTAYCQSKQPISIQQLQALYKKFYKQEYFIRLHNDPMAISPSHLRGSNFCDMGVFLNEDTNQIINISALDNLVKGAAGQAIQAMNLMAGLPETLGLSLPPLYP
jgi:N-acetyl-gamma-glutamyl-phosphate reductase